MDLMKRCRVLLLAGCLALTGAVPALADYTSWQDPQYDFSNVKTVYMAQMDMSGYGLQNLAKKQKMVDHFNTRAAKTKLKKAKLVVEPVSQPRALLPGEKPAVPEKEAEPARQQALEKQLEPSKTNDATQVTIPQAALDAKADVYILPRMDSCAVSSYLVPAHTEWRTDEIPESWRDDDGHWHTFYRTVTYPEYYPDSYVPYTAVSVQFQWFDTKTGKLVASSQDARARGSENNPMDIYDRILDRFFKNMKTILNK
ncbi:MAG: hypothetical protein Q4F92_02215 [Acidaminococcus sp.]|uniref:hypothetical protein n=1 Tax=Acidaminococcus TaxID=904 RepID=UPI002665FA8A|nr:hypothetical protein [Acidaminococcus sp.]MDO5597144.1 hypothetical protein [Acidaminococcus sp.]